MMKSLSLKLQSNLSERKCNEIIKPKTEIKPQCNKYDEIIKRKLHPKLKLNLEVKSLERNNKYEQTLS